jgi:YggT family protein
MNQLLFSTGQLLIEFVISFFSIAVLLRFILQAVRANFYNPIGQFVLTVTSPVVVPLRKVIPSAYGYDLASLVLLYLLQVIKMAALMGLTLLVSSAAALPNVGIIFGVALVETLNLFLNFYLFAIFAQVIISWLPNLQNHPAASMVHQIVDPILRPFQRFIPPIAGLDLSPIFALLGLQLIKIWVVYPLT